MMKMSIEVFDSVMLFLLQKKKVHLLTATELISCPLTLFVLKRIGDTESAASSLKD